MILVWPTCSWGSEKSCGQYIISSLSSLMNLGISPCVYTLYDPIILKRFNILCFVFLSTNVYFKIVKLYIHFPNYINWIFFQYGTTPPTVLFWKISICWKWVYYTCFLYEINIYRSNTSSLKSTLLLFNISFFVGENGKTGWQSKDRVAAILCWYCITTWSPQYCISLCHRHWLKWFRGQVSNPTAWES